MKKNTLRQIRALTRVGLEQKCVVQRDLLLEIKRWMGSRIPYSIFETIPKHVTDGICEHTD